jgi:hypothetical protein
MKATLEKLSEDLSHIVACLCWYFPTIDIKLFLVFAERAIWGDFAISLEVNLIANDHEHDLIEVKVLVLLWSEYWRDEAMPTRRRRFEAQWHHRLLTLHLHLCSRLCSGICSAIDQQCPRGWLWYFGCGLALFLREIQLQQWPSDPSWTRCGCSEWRCLFCLYLLSQSQRF